MNECFGKKFILDGVLQPAENFDNMLVYEGDSVYEVIRMMNGVPVFFPDHMKRLELSVRYQKKKQLADSSRISIDVLKLVKTEKRKEINLKIVFNYSRESNHYLIYFIEPIYPSEEQYRNGVKGILYFAERKDPESKVINHKLRSSIYHKLILEGGYEALLVNEKKCVTEGSRSNLFFLKGNTLTTAPDNMVLNGITRKYILEICKEDNIKVEFKCVHVESIMYYDSVFMTGTSPMVLEFYRIGDIHFNKRPILIKRLRELYMMKAEESVKRFLETGNRKTGT